MMRSLYAAVSGLTLEQTAMDVIGNNIANVNTPGFKQSRAMFAELFAQTLHAASASTTTLGGIDPAQVGLGVELAGIEADMGQGSIQVTGKSTDLAISGNGMFVLDAGGGQPAYTRVGDFKLDAQGYLVNGLGQRAQGWTAQNGSFGPEQANNLTDVQIPIGSTKAPTATSAVTYVGNLDATTPPTGNVAVPVPVYDSMGNIATLTLTFTPTGNAGIWNWAASGPSGTSGSGTVTFTSAGAYSATTGGPVTFTPTDGAAPVSIKPDFSQMTLYAQPSTASALSQNGSRAGSLETFTIDSNGIVTGVYSNGQSQAIAQVGMADFANPGGLVKLGGSVYAQSDNSGLPQVGTAGTGGRGTIASGSLEQSNVDLATQFTDMITTQRAFQANAQVISTANQMLQVLATLKQG